MTESKFAGWMTAPFDSELFRDGLQEYLRLTGDRDGAQWRKQYLQDFPVPEWIETRHKMPPVGHKIEIVVKDRFGETTLPGAHFLHEDGEFYRVDKAVLIKARVSKWKPAR